MRLLEREAYKYGFAGVIGTGLHSESAREREREESE